MMVVALLYRSLSFVVDFKRRVADVVQTIVLLE
jgi:hypothetical protein